MTSPATSTMSSATTTTPRAALPPALRALVVLAVTTALGVASVVGHLLLGRTELPPGDIIDTLLGRAPHPSYTVIVMEYRLPRVFVGLGAGALLAVSGVLVQAVVSNPLAEPSTTGVGSGAALGVTATTLFLTPDHVYPAAIAGALLTGLLLWLVGRRSLVMAGVLLGAVLSAITSLLLVHDSASMGIVMRWLVGSLNARTQDDWSALWPWLAVILPASWLLTSRLNVWALGTPVAIGLGVRPAPLLALTLLLAVASAAAAVAAAGAVVFVGLVAPHVARLLVGVDHRALVPTAAAIGAVLLSVADLMAFSLTLHLPGITTDVSGVPVGAVTALLGAPVLIWLIRKEIRR